MLCAFGAGVRAETSAPTAPPATAVEPAPSASHAGPLPAAKPAVAVSKFEARRVRHACQERANKENLKGADREAFLTRCFFGRAATRKLRHECRKQGLAKGVDKAQLRDYVRDCVKEQRAHQKLPE